MRILSPIILTTLFVTVTAGRALAADVTEAELMQAAIELGRQYDANYANKNPAAMAALYAPDGLLVSPAGPIVRGREALRTYYTNRFASGARGHAIKVVEVHVQGNGGYGLIQFSVTVPTASGGSHEVLGSIVAIYQRDPDGWHMRLIEPSVPEPAAK
jgi:uncharacterized protein (TIGR02246 family)